MRDTRRLIIAIIALLEEKNSDDQLQEFLWCLRRSRAGFDGAEIVDAVAEMEQAEVGAGVEALKTVGELLMGNKEFRRLVEDATVLAREVVSETAEVGAEKVKVVAEAIRPEEGEVERVADGVPAGVEEEEMKVGMNGKRKEPEEVVKDVAEALGEGVRDTVIAGVENTKEVLEAEGKGEVLLERMKRTVLRLKARTDYTDSVSIVSTLLKRYALAYSRSLSAPTETLADAIHTNSALDEAAAKFWSLITSFGSPSEWDSLLQHWDDLLSHLTSDTDFERLMNEAGSVFTDILTDPNLFTSSQTLEQRLTPLRNLAASFNTTYTTSLSDSLLNLISQLSRTLQSITADKSLANIITHSRSIITNISGPPGGGFTFNPSLASDLTHILLPTLFSLIQHIPLLRLTVSSPEIDLLIENLILTPGDTINASSFFPHRLSLTSTSSFSLSKPHTKKIVYNSTASSNATIKLSGLSLRADEVGYYLRAHTGIWRFWDEGIVSILLDEKGIDVTLDVEFARDRVENLVTLNNVVVDIHKLNYVIHQSRFRWLAWPFKPILKRILRRILKQQFEAAIFDAGRFVNREVVFARERLRAARVARPKTWWRFLKAVGARLRLPEQTGDLEVGFGVTSKKGEGYGGVFENRYAPGSVVGLWEREGEGVEEWVDVGAVGERERGREGWRNKAFDVVADDE